MADICMACFVVWTLYSDLCMVCFFHNVFLISDTAVALRRSICLILCITLVAYIKVYDDYFCKLMWLSANSPDVFEAQHYWTVKRQCKLRFLDININFIEQNIHVLGNMKSCDEDHQKVSESFYLFFCFFWLLSLAGKCLCVFLWLASDLT
jgi:hypothetical protein